MRYTEAEWQAMERRGDLDYADRRVPVPPPRLIDCTRCGGYHPDVIPCEEVPRGD